MTSKIIPARDKKEGSRQNLQKSSRVEEEEEKRKETSNLKLSKSPCKNRTIRRPLVQKTMRLYPTDPFNNREPRYQEIGDFYKVQQGRKTDPEAPKL